MAFRSEFGEDIVDVVVSVFAVLVGIALENFLANPQQHFCPVPTKLFHWSAFAALICLSLRFIIGSNVHLKETYIPARRAAAGKAAEERVWRFDKDLLSLIFFGVALVQAAGATTFRAFLGWLITFLAASIVWDISERACENSRFWKKWLVMDFTQCALTIVLCCLYASFPTGWAIPVALGVVYVGCLFWDLQGLVQA
jgi:hypothetical protein